MRKRKLSVIAPIMILLITLPYLSISPATSQNTDAIISKLEELRSRVKTEKPALANKVNAVIHQIEAGAFNAALNKMQNDIRKSILAWVDNPEDLIRLVDEIIDLIKGIAPPPPPTPDFKITADPSELRIQQGSLDTANITIISEYGFNQEVTLTNTTTALSGVKLSLNPSTLTPPPNASANSTLKVEVSANAQPKQYEITVSATNGSLTHSAQIALTVTAAPPPHPDFSISASPSILTIQQGDSDAAVITITSIEGFSQPVDLVVTSDQITGVTTSLNPTKVIPPADSSAISILTIEIAEDTAVGSCTIIVTGNSSTIEHSTRVSLEVTAPPTPPTPDFSLNASPSTLTVEQGNSATATIIVVSLNGFNQPVTLTLTSRGIQEVTVNIDPNEVTPEPDGFVISTLTVTVGNDAIPNDYLITIGGTKGSMTRTVDISLKIVTEKTPPEIVSVLRLPETPSYNQSVSIMASVTDASSGIKEVILGYSYGTTNKNVTMVLQEGVYTASIPALPYNTSVSYSVYAFDNAGNQAKSSLYSYNVTDPYAPSIGHPSWLPVQPAAFEEITINVTATEPINASGISSVVISYKNKTLDDWLSVLMVLQSGNYTVTLNGQSDTSVQFFIKAVDKAGNMAESPEHEFTVSPPAAVSLAWILAAILAITAVIGGSAYYARKQQKKRPAATSPAAPS